MQHIHVERKKEVFLDHVRQKYPQHAVIIMGHQDPMKESPQLTDRPHCTGVTGLVKDQDRLVSSNMSDGDVIPPSVPFTRGSKARASLPVGRSSGQTRERPFGVLFLQYGEETKQVWVPTEISSRDALRGLFVNAFPHQLTVKMLQSPNMAIYIKDTSHNVYYDLEDISLLGLRLFSTQDYSHAFWHVFPFLQISKEALYGSHSPVHTLSSLQGSMSPPMVRSMPSSPSRVAYGGVGKRGGSGGVWDPSSTLPRERLSGAGRSSAMSTSSAILERRDIKPGEIPAVSQLIPIQYGYPLHPNNKAHHNIILQHTHLCINLYSMPSAFLLSRQKSKKYSVSQLPPMGTKTPSPSPHRVSDIRMTDGGQIIGGMGLVSPEKISPIRRSLRQDGSSSTVEIVSRSRGSGSSSSASSVFADSPLGQSERLFQSHMNASSAQR
uniref:Actin interacting protein 3-like C-terminal domain-containing protein n=1 Tax=Amphilophus citrinellus TaxID=61819 RepID=A0A3Q0R9W7_AMPCI